MKNCLMFVLAVSVFLAGCGWEPAFERQARKAALAQELRSNLLEAVAAEKSAVMAITDQESSAFAQQAQQRTATAERIRDELHRRVVADRRSAELEALSAFDDAWAESRDVDRRLLGLAVANSNLKAARLAAGESAAAVDRLVDSLTAVGTQSSDLRLLRVLSAAEVSALRIQTHLAPHIASADDAEMTRLEEHVRQLREQVGEALDEARASAPAGAHGRLADAEAAWSDYQRLVTDVIRLSRLNTNVHSVDVSLHEKQRVTEACLKALSALIAEVQESPTPSR